LAPGLIKTQRYCQDILSDLKKAREQNKEISIIGHLRGVDGAGSSLDLPEFQMVLTERGAENLEDIPSTPTIASSFKVKVIFDLAEDVEAIEYIAPDYGIGEDQPYCVVGEISLNTQGRTPHGQKDAPAYIFRNIFDLKGIKITLPKISPMAIAGGMESSNAFNLALIAGAGILSGADLSFADMFHLAVKLENDEFGGSTGGQGTLATMLAGAYKHVWLSGIKDHNDQCRYPYSVLSEPLLSKKELFALESHMMFVQTGKEYADGQAVQSRTAFLINEMWLDLLRDRDEIGFPLHKEKLSLTAIYADALKAADFPTVVKTINSYVDIRNDLVARWFNLMLDAHQGKDVSSCAARYARKVFDENNSYYFHYKIIRTLYEEHEDKLRNIRLYTFEPIDRFLNAGRYEGVAVMPLGAGGPGANCVAISAKGRQDLKQFLESQGLDEINEENASAIIRGTGTLKGYFPFKVGMEPLVFNGFQELGYQVPKAPEISSHFVSDILDGKIIPIE